MRVLLLLSVAVLAAAGCNAVRLTCDQQGVAGIAVTVVDSTTLLAPAGASLVTATDGVYVDTADESLLSIPDTAVYSGPYTLAIDRPGTYVVDVRHSGFGKWSRTGVRVVQSSCNVNTVGITAELQPAS